jgi:hypothetical protein
MIRKNKQTDRPLYRDLIREAFVQAWSHRHVWVLGALAGILQTGGLYDVLLANIRTLQNQAQTFLDGGSANFVAAIQAQLATLSRFQASITGLSLFQGLLFAGLIAFAVFVLSLLGQMALVKGLSAKSRDKFSTRDLLAYASHHLWPAAGLNVFTLVLMWVLHFLVLIPFSAAITQLSYLTVGLYFVAFVAFLVAAVALTAIHLFALQAMVLDEEHLWPAILHGARLVREAWVVVLETGAALFVVGIGILLSALTAFVVMLVPLFLLLVTAALLQYWSLVSFGAYLAIALFFLVMVTAAAFTVTFQYATWQKLYLRLEEGTAMAKVFRLIRRLVHGTR